jgi:hypothetical protein
VSTCGATRPAHTVLAAGAGAGVRACVHLPAPTPPLPSLAWRGRGGLQGPAAPCCRCPPHVQPPGPGRAVAGVQAQQRQHERGGAGACQGLLARGARQGGVDKVDALGHLALWLERVDRRLRRGGGTGAGCAGRRVLGAGCSRVDGSGHQVWPPAAKRFPFPPPKQQHPAPAPGTQRSSLRPRPRPHLAGEALVVGVQQGPAVLHRGQLRLQQRDLKSARLAVQVASQHGAHAAGTAEGRDDLRGRGGAGQGEAPSWAACMGPAAARVAGPEASV